VPVGLFPRTPSCANTSFVDPPNPLTRHSYIVLTLSVFVGMRALTFVRSVPLPLTHPSDCGSSSVCNLMRRHPIHLFRPASRDRGPPLVYPVNGIRSDRWLRRIRSYQLGSNHRRHWCWDSTTQPARDDAPSQRRGWRGVLSFSFQAHACQGRVTLPWDFL